MKPGDIQDVRAELQGKTDLNPEYEEGLFKKIAAVEQEGGVLDPLPKVDYYFIGVLFLVCIGMIARAVSFR